MTSRWLISWFPPGVFYEPGEANPALSGAPAV
jgi:hypothetical protein